jgi:hypothetical protein
LYDPATGTWSATADMLRPLGGFPATLLRDGRVLVGDSLGEDRPGAELYDPATGTWSDTGMPISGASHAADTATLLADGKVLVAGLEGAQLYDSASGTWSATAEMTTPRYFATATLLPDGRVLAAGGYVVPDVISDAAELYDPNSGSWTAIANMHAPHGHHTATLLRDGNVLVSSSSFDTAGGSQLEAEVYDPATGTWTALPVRPGIAMGTTTLLADGRVLVADPYPDSVAAELYDPDTGSWLTVATMLRSHGTPAILLLDGTVLVAGGRDCSDDGICVATGSAELYVPAGVAPPPLPTFPPPPPPVIPSPTPRPTPYPPQAGPIPPNARSWTVTVVNESSKPATLFVAEEDGDGMLRLVGSAAPNVVPAGVTANVTFLFPAKSDPDDGWIFVNPRPGEGGSLVSAADIGIPGRIVITADGQVGWLGS